MASRFTDIAAEGPPNGQILSPSQLNALARDLLEGSFPAVWVEGEISNLARPSSGHIYLTLKDARAQLRCAFFRPKSTWLKFQPANGMQVLARGRLSLYDARGDYQLILDHMEEAGDGALRRAFEQLKSKLEQEGLFAPERKKALPALVRRLGVITSPTGAAIRDVLSVLKRRFPLLDVELLPVPVQGDGAAREITRTLLRADQSGRYDALLITRGGGSLEDLIAFNDEALARAVAGCTTPIVSAIGHEIDFSICDFVADLRAPTPSAAAELLVPDRRALAQRLDDLERRLTRFVGAALQSRSQPLQQLRQRLINASPQQRMAQGAQRLSQLQLRLRSAGSRQQRERGQTLGMLLQRLRQQHPQRWLSRDRDRLQMASTQLRRLTLQHLQRSAQQTAALARALNAVSPLATLSRGYAILHQSNASATSVVTDSSQVQIGDRLRARLHRGQLQLTVDAILPPTGRSSDESGSTPSGDPTASI